MSKKKMVKSVRCRYLAKSHIINCNAQNQSFIYANFRGAIFTKVKFNNSTITGCDFWLSNIVRISSGSVSIMKGIYLVILFRK
jgi:hypothetical protein